MRKDKNFYIISLGFKVIYIILKRYKCENLIIFILHKKVGNMAYPEDC